GGTSTIDPRGRDTRIKEEEMRVVFVHGACVRDGSWWWHLATAALQERGISSVAPALPSCGEGDRPAGPQGPGLPEEVAAVRAALTAMAGAGPGQNVTSLMSQRLLAGSDRRGRPSRDLPTRLFFISPYWPATTRCVAARPTPSGRPSATLPSPARSSTASQRGAVSRTERRISRAWGRPAR